MSDRPRKKLRITRSRSSASALGAGTPSLSSNTAPAEQSLAILPPPLDAHQMAHFPPPSPTTATEDTYDLNEKYGLFRLQPVLTTTSNNEHAATSAVDIVAVHGITGDAYGTWTHDNGTMWLRDLIPKDLPGVRVFSYGYPAKVFFTLGTGGLEDFSRGLLEGLRGERRGKEVFYNSTLSRKCLLILFSMRSVQSYSSVIVWEGSSLKRLDKIHTFSLVCLSLY
jgi:hypothetical protein